MRICDILDEKLQPYLTALKGKWQLPERLHDYLAQNGFRMLGQGEYADVFGRDGDRMVLKVGKIDTDGRAGCYVKFLEYVMQHPENPHLPKVGKVRWFANDNGDRFFAVLIERLQPIESNEIAALIRTWMHDYYVTDKPVPPELQQKLQPYLGILKIIEDLEDILVSGQCFMDIHQGNFMMRGNTLVFSDPLA